MRFFLRCFKTEFMKHRRTPFYLIHIIIPTAGALIFTAYFHSVQMNVQSGTSGYFEILAIVFPFLAGILCGMTVQLENEAGSFQALIGTLPSRTAVYLAKICFLLAMAFFSILLAVGIFASLFPAAPFAFYLQAAFGLLLTIIPLYLLALAVSFIFGKSASIVMGICGSILSALMMTGLGDSCWPFIPWAWGVRLMDLSIIKWIDPQSFASIKDYFSALLNISAVCSLVLLLISLLWFSRFEGQKAEE